MNTLDYWKRVRALQRELEQTHGTEPVFVATLEHTDTRLPAGAVSIVAPELAARLICNGHHAIATDEQIAEFRAEHARRGALIGVHGRQMARSNREDKGIRYHSREIQIEQGRALANERLAAALLSHGRSPKKRRASGRFTRRSIPRWPSEISSGRKSSGSVRMLKRCTPGYPAENFLL